jgi:hypothetical protein
MFRMSKEPLFPVCKSLLANDLCDKEDLSKDKSMTSQNNKTEEAEEETSSDEMQFVEHIQPSHYILTYINYKRCF